MTTHDGRVTFLVGCNGYSLYINVHNTHTMLFKIHVMKCCKAKMHLKLIKLNTSTWKKKPMNNDQ